ncbi:MAG: PQQ-like beta-propeller repeat protein [Verrucomicrobia bacterium]|nr:PQQ-like beta-propeller repeat protein [Verrucomicrobiota bacterium]
MKRVISTRCLGPVLGMGIGLCFLPLETRAADWPQWRGPQRNGISAETGLLAEWPKEGPKLVWQVKDIDSGYSTPSVVGDRLYLLSNQGLDNEFVQALDTKGGKRVWSQRIGKVGNPDQQPNYPAARSTPTVDGEQLLAFGSDGDLACLERATGKVRWQKNVRKDYGGQPGIWAYSESPLVDGEAVICTPGGPDATLLALNKNTGELIWKCALPGGEQAAYTSALVIEAGGVRQYVQMLQKGLVGIEAKTGRLLWRYDRTAKGSPAVIPTPVVDGDFIYSAAGRSGGGGVRSKVNGGTFETEQLYFSPKLPTSVGGVLKVGEYLYGTSAGALLCLEFKTGNVKWDDRSIGAAALCYADGRLYLHGENGEVALLEATPEAYREKGRFKPVDQPDRGSSKAWAYPIIADGRLYIRDLGTLWCYDVKAGK